MSIIYAWDERWPGEQRFASSHKPWTRDHIFGFAVRKGTSIASVVRSIINVSQGYGRIHLVRLCAHGNVGYLEMGEGLSARNANQFALLNKYFSHDPPSFLEIHGCAVAGQRMAQRINTRQCAYEILHPSPAGKQFVVAMADALGVPVRAGIHCQLADPDYDFEGPIMFAVPNSNGFVVEYEPK